MGSSESTAENPIAYGWKMLTVIAAAALATFGALFLGSRLTRHHARSQK